MKTLAINGKRYSLTPLQVTTGGVDDLQITTSLVSNSAIESDNGAEAMQARIAELESLIKEADDYLNINNLTRIGSGSILHSAFKEALRNSQCVKTKKSA